jgi:hypothetical protein
VYPGRVGTLAVIAGIAWPNVAVNPATCPPSPPLALKLITQLSFSVPDRLFGSWQPVKPAAITRANRNKNFLKIFSFYYNISHYFAFSMFFYGFLKFILL